jgi:sortase A
MKDRRCVDDLPLEELERVLLIRRREARLAQLRRMDRPPLPAGRDPLAAPAPPPVSTAHREFEGIGASATYRAVEVQEPQRRTVPVRLLCWLALPSRVNWRFVFRGFMLFIETAAVAGLVLVVITTWQQEREINQEAEDLFVPPTPTATPAPLPPVWAVILPGGHTPPDARGFSQAAPLPEALRGRLARVTPQPLPTPGPEHPMRVVIPSIGVDHRVVLGDDWEALKRGVGFTPGSAPPGQAGNCVLVAHNDIFGAIFRRLPDLELGDEILVYTSNQVYRYVIRATHVVEPAQTEVMEPTEDAMLTLISSYPYLVDDRRIVVVAELATP